MITSFRSVLILAAFGTAFAATPGFADSKIDDFTKKFEKQKEIQKQKTRGLSIATPNATGTTTDTAATAVATTDIPKDQQVNVNISFDFDSAALRGDQKPKLVELCQALVAANVQQVRILGHTDASGSAAYNLQLSKLRAEEVKRFLNSDCGYPLERMDAVGVGEARPFDENNPNGDVNRRVEFQALS